MDTAQDCPVAVIDPEVVAELIGEADIEHDGQYVDNGIGPYEYWGSRGTDVRMEVEVETIEDVKITRPDDVEGDEFPANVSTSHWLQVDLPCKRNVEPDSTEVRVEVDWTLKSVEHDEATYRADHITC